MDFNDDIKNFMDRVKKLEKNEKLDLSSDEDLSVCIMNLISIEEHLFFSGSKTGKKEYFHLLNEIREMRKTLLKKIIKEYEGEVWCISKHLLAASMRLMEVGTKLIGKGNEKEANIMFANSYKLYSLFWGLNLGLVKTGDIRQKQTTSVELLKEDELTGKQGSISLFDKLGQIVKKVIDCCKE